MMRLSGAALNVLPATIAVPAYDRSRVCAGVVHFGPGAFHRAHQAAAFDTLLASDPRWGVTGVSLNSTAVAEALNPQEGLFTLALLDADAEYRVIGAIGRILTASDRAAIFAAVAAPDTRIVSTTITEKGYCLAGDGTLDFTNPAIAADLTRPASPSSAIGWIVAALGARRRLGLGGLTLLSCDNLADNGRKFGAAIRAFASVVDPDTAAWIEQQCRFPNAMVDSITPATDAALRERVCAATGLEDAWPIQRERFTQWVIEDDFAGERPELDRAGVTFTHDVGGYEAAKLRLLNGAHSSLAYLGLGLGYASVAEAMADARLARFIERLMRDDIAPSLSPPAGLDLDRYIDDVLARFSNRAIHHKLAQIACDGSQKLPYRILGTMRDALEAGRPIARLAVPIAAWLRFIEQMTASGTQIVDPLAQSLLGAGPNWRSILAMPEIFGELSGNPAVVGAVERAHAALADPAGYA